MGKWVSRRKKYVRPTPRLEFLLEQLPDVVQVPIRALQIIVEVQCDVFGCEADERAVGWFAAYKEGVLRELFASIRKDLDLG